MRGSRFAPTCALLATVAAAAVALLTSRSGDWDKPVVFVLVGAMALIADRYVIRSPTGTIVVATHPVFVLGMVALGPVPMLLIGQAVVFANRPKKVQVLVGNAAVYAVFLVAGSLLARLMRHGLERAGILGMVRGRRGCAVPCRPGRSTSCSIAAYMLVASRGAYRP